MSTLSSGFRLGLFTIMLLCGVALLGFAQQIIASGAELSSSSPFFESSSIEPTAWAGFDPAAALMVEDVFSADGVDMAADDTQYVDSTTPAGMTGPGSGPNSLIPPSDPFTVTVAQPGAAPAVHIYPAPGWPRTTAEITLAATIANPPVDGKWIDINLTTQTVSAYSGTVPVKSVLTSTGTRVHPTVVGLFHVWAKVASQTMRGGSVRNHDRYNLPGVPNILYFYQGYSLHGAYWHRNFGHPMSHGCANLTLDDAAWFYAWTPLGTPVRTHYAG